jgi:hypothetical protein
MQEASGPPHPKKKKKNPTTTPKKLVNEARTLAHSFICLAFSKKKR